MHSFFKKKSKSCLGIDIGTTSIKIVELSLSGEVKKLENYGEISVDKFTSGIFRSFDESNLSLSIKEVSKAILLLNKEAGFKAKVANFSIPDFSTFFTTFDLPPMLEEEIPQAVRFQANRYVPLPLVEMNIDWAIIEGKPSSKNFWGKETQGTELKILLVTVPNNVISYYQEIAKASKLETLSLEAEVLSLVKALVKEEEAVILVDIGGRSTTCSLIEKGILKTSHSFDISSNEFTYALSKSLDIDYNEAERIKREIGMRKGSKEETILYPLVGLVLREIRSISSSFSKNNKKKISKIILAGGGASMPYLTEYFSQELGINTAVANPFASISYPPSLKKVLEEMGPSYSIAVGLALKGLEKEIVQKQIK